MVSIQIKAFLRWLAVAVLLAALLFTKDQPGSVGLILAGSLLLLVASAFFWPKCPHCDAPAVQFDELEWIPGQVCWSCHRPYDESTPACTVEMDQAVEEAEKIRKKDPALYERLIRDAGQRFETAYQAEKVSLRERAKRDRAAQRVLRLWLTNELKGLVRAQKVIQKTIDRDPAARDTLLELERDARAIQAELDTMAALTDQRDAAV